MLTRHWQRVSSRRVTQTMCCLCMISVSTPSLADITLAANGEVLEAWQQYAQAAEATPNLVVQEDGGTKIEWHGNVSVDAYNNSVSGGSLLTPLREGNYYKTNLQGDLRKTLKSGGLSYMQFSASHTNDRAVLTNNSQLDTFQAGIVENSYGISFGDVAAGFSTLGTNTQMKGLYGYKQFENTVITASAGKMAESWEVLAGTADNTLYESDAYALKVDMSAGQYSRVYFTHQAFKEDEDSLDAALRFTTAAQANTTTAGFSFQKERVTLQAEYGGSYWEETSGYSYHDSAAVIDVQWRGEKGGVSVGYHDIGKFYSSLAAGITPGMGETYVAADWLPVQWLSLAVDLRNSTNNQAVYASDIEDTDTVTGQMGLSLDKYVKGLNLSFQQSRSDGTAVDSSSNVVEDRALNLSYASQYWSGQIGNSYQSVTNSGYPEYNSDTESWSGAFNISLNRNPETLSVWNMGVGLNANLQRQDMESSADITTRSYTFSLDAQRQSLGMLIASYTAGTTSQGAGGPEIDQVQIQLEASRTWGETNTIKCYIRDNDNSGDAASEYSESTVGLQLVMAW